MKLLVEISGEAPELAKAEIEAVCLAEGKTFSKEVEDGRALIIETDAEPDIIASRLALAWSINSFNVSCDIKDAPARVQGIELPGETFRVTIRRLGEFSSKESIDLTGKIGAAFSKRYKVNLSSPDAEIRVLLTERCHIGTHIKEIDRSQFESRKSENRPFSHPISLHPKLARALVNLSGVRNGQSVLDPFCGTGGILLEAGLMGMKALGSDIDERMTSGTRQNLDHYGIGDAELKLCDVSEIPSHFGQADAIVTDPPYGRAASTGKEPIELLYERAFDAFSKVLKPGGKLAIVLPSKEYVELGQRYFSLHGEYDVRVHRSLTRYFCVFSA